MAAPRHVPRPIDCGRRDRLHRIQQLAAGQEHDAAAAQGQQIAAGSGELLHVMQAPLDGADGNRVDDEERLYPCLDREEASETLEHQHG
jgi:hypothetical protein